MELEALRKIVRKLRIDLEVEDEEGIPQVVASIVFNWLPASITKATLPAYIALDDEPLAIAQRQTLANNIEIIQTAQQIQAGVPASLNMEELEDLIDKRRARQMIPEEIRADLAAKKLLLLLDPEEPSDLTLNGVPIKTWEQFAFHVPVDILEVAAEKIMGLMGNAFFPWRRKEHGGDTSSGSNAPAQ